MKNACDRCGNQNPTTTIMSKFNTDILCPSCKEKETKHPMYKQACDAEIAEVRKGNYNFPGIGKPDDL